MLKIFQFVFKIAFNLRYACSVVFIVFVSILATHSLAEETDTEAKWYQVEYIIFEHRQTDDHILRYEDIPYPKKTNKQFSYITSNVHPATRHQYTQLAEEKMDLANAFQKLKQSRAVRVLDMKAWQQPLSGASFPPIKIHTQVNQQRTLFGELQLKKSRYTHAEFKLFLTQTINMPYRDIKHWFLDKNTKWSLLDILKPTSKNFPFTELIGTSELHQNIRYLGESRRIKEGEIHYIDHPVISAIITMKEVPSPFKLSNESTYDGQ